MMSETDLIDVRCPMERGDGSGKPCNRLCVRVKAGSSGQAHCPRHDKAFEFEVDDFRTISATIKTEKPQSD